MSLGHLRSRHVRFVRPPARASEPSPARRTAFSSKRNKDRAKQLKWPDMAKSPASPRLRLSGESPAKRSHWIRFRFVSFRLISSALGGSRAWRRMSHLGPLGLAPRAARRLPVHPATARRLPWAEFYFNQSID
jgi:hypothetical protein